MKKFLLSTRFMRRWTLAAGCLLGASMAAHAQAPANDECAGAIQLTPSSTCVPTSGTTVNATQSLPSAGTANPTGAVLCAGSYGTADDDVWYKFTALASSQAINVTPTSGMDVVVDVRSGACPGVNITCEDTNGLGAAEYLVATGLTPGSTYYIRIYSFSAGAGTQGTFNICVTAAPSCTAPTNVTVGSISGTSASVSFVGAASGVGGYTVSYTPASGGATQTVTVTNSPANLTGLTLGTTYNVTVVSNCTAGGTSNPVTTSFATTGVANDDCSSAITLTPSATCVPTSGTTVGASQSQPASTCNGFTSTSAIDVWYKFVAVSTTATVTEQPVSAGFDGVLDVRSGTCGGTTTSLGCADVIGSGPTANPEIVNLTGLTVGTTYYIRVYAYGTGTGSFTICVTGVPCPAPTGLTATNVTATSATVSFTPPTQFATSYTLTYSAAGGALQTQTVTASPINLTNLTPGSVYTLSLVSNCSQTQSSGAVTATFTTLAACPVVTSLSATNVTATSATLNFTPPAGGASYTVTYTPAGGTAQTVTATGSPVTLTGLTPGKGYTVSVVTNCTGTTTGATSAPVTTNFTTPTVCQPVTGLTATAITANSVTLTFTSAPTGTSYSILYSVSGGPTQVTTVANSPATLTGLLAGKTYTVNIISTCGTSQTSVAATTTFTTAAAPPTNATANPVQPTTAGINFTAPAGAVAYTITYTANGTTSTITSTGSPMTLTGLLPNTTYTITIVATYPGGGQSSPVTLTFTTGVLSTRSALAGGQVLVFPNPAHAAFTVELPALGAARTASLELLNALGQRVRQQTVSLNAGGTQAPVDASALPAGIYLLRVQADGQTAVTRVVLE